MATKKNRKSFQQELIDAILNEDNKFDMQDFKSGSLLTTATCNTARCMAGHIEALRPERAKQLAKELGLRTNDWKCGAIHSDIASTIWKEETGTECHLDFFGSERHGDMKYALGGGVRFLGDITREEAVAHIQGENPDWPLLNR